MRVTKRTDIALRVLMYCAIKRGERITKSSIAQVCNVSEHHLGQIVNQLAQLGYLRTQRGRKGGLALALAEEDITVGAVFRSFESKVPIVECQDMATNTCPLATACRLRTALDSAEEEFYKSLDDVNLASLVVGNSELSRIFSAT